MAKGIVIVLPVAEWLALQEAGRSLYKKVFYFHSLKTCMLRLNTLNLCVYIHLLSYSLPMHNVCMKPLLRLQDNEWIQRLSTRVTSC